MIGGQRPGEGVRILAAGLRRGEERHVAHRLVELEACRGRSGLGVGALEQREGPEVEGGEGREMDRHQEAPEAHPGGCQLQAPGGEASLGEG